MNKKILITYASRTGSTAQIAEVICKTIAQNGAEAELLPMQNVKDLSRYHAVIIGSSIRKSRWLPEAMQFIEVHRTELMQKRIATFTVCITLAMSNAEPYQRAVKEWTVPVRAQLHPLSEGLFAGKLDFSRIPLNLDALKMRLVVALGIFPNDDRRDWNAIRAWAESLHPVLLQ